MERRITSRSYFVRSIVAGRFPSPLHLSMSTVIFSRRCFLAIFLHGPQSPILYCVQKTSLSPHVSPVLYSLSHCSRNLPHFQEPH